MNAADIIRQLENDGILLWGQQGELRYRAPKGALTADRRALLSEHKQALLEYLGHSEEIPRLIPGPEERFVPFPITDVQRAYLLGRNQSFAYGGVGCHGYGELILSELQASRVSQAWQAIILRHEMLRTIVYEDGTQQLLEHCPRYEVGVLDLLTMPSEEAAAALAIVRAQMDHRVYQPDVWPLFDVRLTRLNTETVLHFSIDLLIADFVSTQLLLAELQTRIADGARSFPPLRVSFRDYVLATRGTSGSSRYACDRDYWLRRLDSLPSAPELPVLERRSERPPHFCRQSLRLPPQLWARLSRNAAKFGLTPSTVLQTAFCDVIGRWSRHSSFTINVTLQSRLPLHEDIGTVIGDFTSLELLAVDADPKLTFRERASALQNRLWQDLDHRSFSAIEIVRELALRREGGMGLFPVVFTSSLGAPAANELSLGGIGDLRNGITQTPQVWIDCQAMENQGGLIVNWDTREEVFPGRVIEDMFSAFQSLLDRAADDDLWDETDPLKVPPAQLERCRIANATATTFRERLLHEDIVANAFKHPDQPAILTGGICLNYGELLGRAVAVANALRELGAKERDLVAVSLEKGYQQPVAVLGIHLAGCAYLPLDHDQPAARRDQILADAGAVMAIVHSAENLSDWPRGIVFLGINGIVASSTLQPHPKPHTQTDDLAYVIYTSGSTGVPKGVAINHRSALNTIDDINRRFRITSSDRILGVSSLAFDLSVYDIFGVLGVGGCLVLPDDCRRTDPSHWAQLMLQHKVSLWNSVPALMQAFHDFLLGEGNVQAAPASLRLALLSGDWIPVRLPDNMRRLLPALQVISLGGATEASIWSIFHAIEGSASDLVSIPYGRPLANQHFYVLDQVLRPCPEWVAGELYIGGSGLAMGYWRDPAKTAERFIQHPATGERLYKTGDWGRYNNEGVIEFLGREDRQVKVRGYRVELAEVEAAISSYPLTGRAAVISDKEGGANRIIAFVEPKVLSSLSPSGIRPDSTAQLMQEISTDLVAADRYGDYVLLLNESALLSMLFALQQGGLFTPAFDQLLLTLQPHHRRLVRRWIAALTEKQLLFRQPAAGYRPARTVNRTELIEAWQETYVFGQEFGEGELVQQFCDVALALDEFLQSGGKVSTAFPPGKLRELIERLYQQARPMVWSKRAIYSVLKHAIAASCRPFHILQLGAASSFASHEIETLASHGLDFLISDTSGEALEFAAHDLASCRGVHFAIVDTDQPFRLSGLQPNSWDVIIAHNTLHRARNFDVTMANVKDLLRPQGWLVIAEPTRDYYPIMTSLELLLNPDEATGDFLDQRRGQDQTFLPEGEWRDMIVHGGGEWVFSLPALGDPREYPMRVYAARFKMNRSPVEAGELLGFLAKRLPNYMLPSQIQVIDALPLTENAKVDNKSLRSLIHRQNTGSSPHLEGSSDLERRLAALWTEALSIDKIGRDQGFMTLGGDSLIAARLAGRIREKIAESKRIFFDELLQAILRGGSIAELASMLVGAEKDGQAVAAGSLSERDVLTVRQVGGTGNPVRVLVPDDIGDPMAMEDVSSLFSSAGIVLAVVTDNPADFVQLDAKSLVVDAGEMCVNALVDNEHLSIDVIGFGVGTALAVEIARQFTEAGGIIGQLFLVDPFTADGDVSNIATTSSPVRVHSVNAFNAWDRAAYAGDAKILKPQRTSNRDPDAIKFWGGVCLGDLSVISLVDFGSAAIAHAVLDGAEASSVYPRHVLRPCSAEA